MLFKSKKTLGLDLGSSSIKIAELEVGKKDATLKAFAIAATPSSAIEGGELHNVDVLSASVKSLVQNIKSKRKNVATNIAGSSVIVKRVTMPRMEANLVNEQIRWEAEQYIPFDINEISLEFHLLKVSAATSVETMEVLLVAAKKDAVHRHIRLIEGAALKCSILDINNFAIANCFELNYGVLNEAVAILNIGARLTNFCVIERGQVTFCRDIPVGGMNYTNDIHKELGLSLSEAEAIKLSSVGQREVPEEVAKVMQSSTEVLSEEIQSSFDFYMTTSNSPAVSRFYVTGGGAGTTGLVDGVAKASGLPFEVLNPFQAVKYDKKKFSDEYIEQIKPFAAVAIGLGLRKVGDS